MTIFTRQPRSNIKAAIFCYFAEIFATLASLVLPPHS